MDNTQRQLRIYFLCGQNRCRSQIAEVFVKALGRDDIIVRSAGLDPSTLHPLTAQAMQELGIDISENQSKKIDMKFFMSATVIIKLCDEIQERCPIVPFGIRNEHWNIKDPLAGGNASIDQVREARDEIQEKVIKLLQKYNALADKSLTIN
ncbi:arsenate reductase [Paenibacillus taihuensis]|uniref:Arsenate reductase n=1 Tax=Paenibacillus taihuensis TaxID=1156355 RepID=A0A3D9RNV1_9BACL|nr:arsenate reductase ArsC [Paenibacillus taihuensis]REE81569.1 arsenate reductase [Paenibacillus taihuensis]